MSQNVDMNLVNQYKQFGYDEQLILQAMYTCDNIYNQDKMLDCLNNLVKQNQNLIKETVPVSQINNFRNEEEDINKAIMMSYKDHNIYSSDFNSPIERIRQQGIPVGLKNVGNTCYFNSLLQMYFMNYKFVKAILGFQLDQQLMVEEQNSKRIQKSIELVNKLKQLFTFMILSNKKYVDPIYVLQSMVDEQGEQMRIGDQQDVVEFNLYFLARIDEGLKYSKAAANELKTNKSSISLQKSNLSCQQQEPSNLLSSELDFQSQDVNSSRIRYSKNLIQNDEESIVSQLFFGKTINVLEYAQNGETVKKQENDLFAMIVLNIQQSQDLYESWDQYNFQTVNDFYIDGQQTQVKKQVWIQKAPGALFFQIQRLSYDKETKKTHKLDHQFKFEKEIFIDRFLETNKEQYYKIREEVKQLKEQQKLSIRKLDQIQNYQNSNYNLNQLLDLNIHFLKSQNKDDGDVTQIGKSHYLEQTIQTVQEYKQQIEQKIEVLKKEIQEVDQKVESLYSQFKKTKYVLLSILVHNGDAQGGHYYSFNYNYDKKKWFRFNDTIITEEEEEVVFKESLGGYQNKSAYCLIYITQNNIKPDNCKTSILDYIIGSSKQQEIQDLYSKYVYDLKLNTEVEQDNIKFQQEVDEYNAGTLAKSILDSYLFKFESINEQARKGKEQMFKSWEKKYVPILTNFYVFVKNSPKNISNNLEELFKSVLYKKVVEEETQNTQMTSILQSKLTSYVNNLSNFKKPNIYANYPQQSSLIEEYMLRIKINYIVEYSLNRALEGLNMKSIMSLSLASKLIMDASNIQWEKVDFIAIFSRDFIKMQYLVLCWRVQELFKQGKYDQTIPIMNFLNIHTINNQMKDNPFLWQVVVWLTDVINDYKEQINDQYQQFNQIIQKINSQEYVNSDKIQDILDIDNEFKVGLDNLDSKDFQQQYFSIKNDMTQWNNIVQKFTEFKSNYKQILQIFESLFKKKLPVMKKERTSLGF